MKKILISTVFLTALMFSAHGQTKKIVKPTNHKNTVQPLSQNAPKTPIKDFRLKKNLPGVYITFIKAGRNPENTKDVFWLKLHNNTIWDMAVASKGWGEESEIGEYEHLFYDVEKVNKRMSPSVIPIGNIPYRGRDRAAFESGKEIQFYVLREHLAFNLAIAVEFFYYGDPNWAEDGEDSVEETSVKSFADSLLEPRHNAIFSYSQLPADAK